MKHYGGKRIGGYGAVCERARLCRTIISLLALPLLDGVIDAYIDQTLRVP